MKYTDNTIIALIERFRNAVLERNDLRVELQQVRENYQATIADYEKKLTNLTTESQHSVIELQGIIAELTKKLARQNEVIKKTDRNCSEVDDIDTNDLNLANSEAYDDESSKKSFMCAFNRLNYKEITI